MNQKIKLIEITDPFDLSGAMHSELDWVDGKTVADYYPTNVLSNALAISVNGGIVPEDRMASTTLRPGDSLVVCPHVRDGGGDSKSMLRVAAFVALMAATSGAAGAGGWATQMVGATAANSTAAMALVGAANIVGGMAINYLLPVNKPKQEKSPTFDDGPSMTSEEGLAHPVAYGRMRMGGNVIAEYSILDGKTQWYYMLINAGEGPIKSISEIEVNDRPLDEFSNSDIQYETRLGTPDQTVIPWFADTQSVNVVGIRTTDQWQVVGTVGMVDAVRLDFEFPVGLSWNGEGANITLEAEYRQVGTLEWRKFVVLNTDYFTGSGGLQNVDGIVTTTKYPIYNGTVLVQRYQGGDADYYFWSEEPYTPDPASETTDGVTIYAQNGQPVGFYQREEVVGSSNPFNNTVTTSNVLYVGGTFSSRFRRTVVVRPFDTLAQYEIRVRRNGIEKFITDSRRPDTCYLQSIVEITKDEVAHVNTALLAMRVKISETMPTRPKVTFVNGGRVIDVAYDGVTPHDTSSNPAWQVLDAMTNRRYGGGRPISEFDMPKYREWAHYCQSKGLRSNVVFDTQESLWDQVAKIMRTGHAKPVRVGTLSSLAIERAEEPVMTFSVANMVEGSFSESWLPIADRVNELEGVFYDETDRYRRKTLRVVDEVAAGDGRLPRTGTVELVGVTNPQQAWNDLQLALQSNRLLIQSCEFSAPIEAIACVPGDVVIVQHDQPMWGHAGKTDAGSTATQIRLDRPVPTYPNPVLSVHYPALQYGEVALTNAQVTQFADSTLFVWVAAGLNLPKKVDRVRVGGKEYAAFSIEKTAVSGAGSWAPSAPKPAEYRLVTEPIPSNIATPGAVLELWSVDVMEQRPVTGVSTDGLTVTLATALPTVPDAFVNWLYGPIDKVGKPFRVRSISGSHEYERTLTCIEYNPTAYIVGGAVPTPSYSLLDTLQLKNARSLSTGQRVSGLDGTSRIFASVTYDHEQPNLYWSSAVYLSRNGAPTELVGTDMYSVEVPAERGDVLVWTVVARDRFGRSVNVANAPTITYTVLGQQTPPGQVTGFTSQMTEAGLVLSWEPVDSTFYDWEATEIRNGPWSTGVLLQDVAGGLLSWNAGYLVQGTHTFAARYRLKGSLYSTADALVEVVADAPAAPTISAPIVLGKAVTLLWSGAKTTNPIDYYQVAVGSTTSAFSSLRKTRVTDESYTLIDEAAGTRRAFVRAVDKAGNLGPIATIDFSTSEITGAKVLILGTDSQVFKIGKTGGHTPAQITLTANTGGSLGGEITWTTDPPMTLMGAGDTRVLTFDNMTGDTVKVTASTVDGQTLFTDSVTIFKIAEGGDGTMLTAMLTNDSVTLSGDSDGNVISYGAATSTMRIFMGIVEDTSNWAFTKIDSPGVTSVISNSTVAITSLDPAQTSGYVEISANRPGYAAQTKRFMVNKVNNAVSFEVQIESTNGNQFRVGQGRETMLIAHAFKNGIEVTDSIAASRFRWRRVSYYPLPAPNDDASWNALYATGYKQVLITVDAVNARATFHCDIFDQPL